MARSRSNNTAASTTLTIDTAGLKDFAKALGKSRLECRTMFRRKMREAGEIIRAEAVTRSPARKVTPTIKLRTSMNGAGIRIQAGGVGNPAKAFEVGNGSGKGRSSTFRHPVFVKRSEMPGKRPWAVQATKPFLRPALEAKRAEFEAAILEGVDEVTRRLAGEFGGDGRLS